MKKLTILLVVVLTAGFSVSNFSCMDKPVGQQEFRKAHTYLNKRVDTLSRNQRVMIRNQKVMYNNQKALLDSIHRLNMQIAQLSGKIDTIKSRLNNLEVGQYVIYDAITSPQQPDKLSKNNFLNLRKWFKKQR